MEPLSRDIADVYISDELERRPQRSRDDRAVTLALQDLARQMVDRSGHVLPRLVDLAMELTASRSGGISLYEEEPSPGVFRWHHLRGELERFSGATTPRNHSPCGVCLDLSKAVLVQRPERMYSWLVEAGVSLPECMLVPLYVGGTEPLGTLWVVSAEEGDYDGGDARVLSDLAAFTGIALHMLQTETRLQQALNRQEMLSEELGHRVRNLLAASRGMVRLSARSATTAQELEHNILGRLEALAAAHELIHRDAAEWGDVQPPVALDDLARTILRPHDTVADGTGEGRYLVDGPPIALGPRAANDLALTLHELATNAAKYGALSREEGKVALDWREAGQHLVMRWVETGGPPIDGEPTRAGFGTTLANTTVVEQMHGTLHRDWRRDGLAIAISLPLDSLGR